MEQAVVIGVLLASVEGGFDPELAAQIQLGLRRPRGHLLPQSLSTHAGLEGAAEFKYLRISRIAIHPDRQRQGLGSQLLQCLATSSPEVDFLGASFAASPELIAFWYCNGCWPLRLGYRREAASGQHSLQLLKPLSKTAFGVWPQWRQRFDEQFPYLLGDPLRHLEPGIAALLLYPQGGARPLDAQDRADLHAFTQGRRDYGGARLALWRLLCLCAHGSDISRIEALILKVFQAHEWHICAQRLGLAGRKAVMERMRQEAGWLLEMPCANQKAAPPQS
jgi:tRNA(Met) cytidine acetyltransferase